MCEDRTQNFTKNISYMIHSSSCHIIHSHVQTIAKLYTQLIRLKGNNFLL